MRSRKNRLGVCVLSLLLVPAVKGIAKPPEPEGDRQFWSAYNDGLMAMREDRLPEAIKAFSQGIRRAPDPRLYLARAAAETLSEQFQNAVDDLSHAHEPAEMGRNPSREPQLWRDCIWAMSDIAPEDAQANGIGGRVFFSGMPGAIVQGGDDYATDYASQLAYETAMAYRQAKQKGGDVHSPELRAEFRTAAQWFANRKLATKPMAAFNYEYARQMLGSGKLREALEAVNLAKVVYPFDADVRFVEAEAYRQLGEPETARRGYTIALTMQTDMAAAYRGRALCAAAEGDARRVQSDMDAAAKYGAEGIAEATRSVNEALKANPLAGKPDELLAKLDAAAAEESVDQLLPLALDLQRASAATSLRYDEIYQDRLHELEDSTREKPKNADAWVAFAAYILDEIRNRGENVEPRRATQNYRYQYSQEMEISRAQFALNKALAINPNHVGALVRMAYAYDDLGNSAKAEETIDKVIGLVGPKNADAIRLLAEYRADEAGSMQAQAHSLRSPHFFSSSHTEDRSDGVYEVTITTRVDPTSGDIQQADDLDARAREMVTQAKAYMEQALKSNPGTLEGMLLRASYENWFGTQDEAQATLEETAKKFPRQLKAQDALTDFYIVHGMADQAIEQRVIADQLFQTTAGPLLERIWRDIRVNGWPPLIADVERARKLNPADARGTYYLAAAQANARDKDASGASLRVAIALEKARLELDDQGADKALPRDAGDVGLLMRMLSAQGVHLSQEGKPERAIADCTEAVKLGEHFSPGGKGEMMFNAMLPDQKAPEIPVPSPVNGATLLAQCEVALGETLQSAGRNNEALAAFGDAANLARPYKSNIPRVGNARGETNFSEDASGPVVTVAFMELAKADMAAGDYRAAGDALNSAGQSGADVSQMQEINNLQMQVAQQINGQMQQQYQPPAYNPPVQGQRPQYPPEYQIQPNRAR